MNDKELMDEFISMICEKAQTSGGYGINYDENICIIDVGSICIKITLEEIDEIPVVKNRPKPKPKN